MTKKHFAALAKTISEVADLNARDELCDKIGKVCDGRNINFDWNEWRKACWPEMLVKKIKPYRDIRID